MNKAFKAIFFDRDGTLSRDNEEFYHRRSSAVAALVNKPDFRLTKELMMSFFWKAWELPGMIPVNTLEREHSFWKKCYQLLLEENGLVSSSERYAADLYEEYPFYKAHELYPETMQILDICRSKRLRMGVISDTFPSLELTMNTLGVGTYFQSFTASSLAGAMKPAPEIFRFALDSLGVEAEESVFVDDTEEEADGARETGFTSFHLDRELKKPDPDNWKINNLMDIAVYLAETASAGNTDGS